MQNDYSDKAFEECSAWLEKKYKNKKKGYSLEKLEMAGKQNDEELNKFLENRVDEDDWPEFSVDEWKEFVNYYYTLWENSKSCIIPSEPSIAGVSDRTVPKGVQTAWQKYKNHLLEDDGFSLPAVMNIEKSVLDTLNFLNDDTQEDGNAVKGLIVGNVQSGKTANMAGLISMAADYGWNLFIILTGTIENLRIQTRERFKRDLKNGNVTWTFLEKPGSKTNDTKLSDLDLNDNRIRYVICCLKNISRLRALHKWLNSDANKKRNLRILIIDDEADQASINTGDINDEKKRTAINQCIRNIVNNTDESEKSKLSANEKDTIQVPYKAMNYVCYTATPYGNFLNEAGMETLYPKDFISVLNPPDLYFGPEQIFGSTNGLPVLNVISGQYNTSETDGPDGDIAQLEDLCAAPSENLPESLKQAIAWFCDAVAIQRVWEYKKPVTMLVHHSMRTEKHLGLGISIRDWLNHIDTEAFLSICREVYVSQTAQLTKDIFKSCWPDYGCYSGVDIERDIKDYPAFDTLITHLKDLKQDISHIEMDCEGALIFKKGIHICIDNCKNDEIIDGEPDYSSHVRLIYPERDSDYDGFAPAFLVIGGNTLSRGLTLEGLVCTYFSREVKQADSLMQMARWFGFRKGYELLPRIWLTKMAQRQFEFLTRLDKELRKDLYKYQGVTTPTECGPLILQTPSAIRMLLTSKNKSQSVVDAMMDFSGANLQTFNFINDKRLLEQQLEVADSFIKKLPDCSFKKDGTRIVWENVSFDVIWSQLLKYIQWPFSQTMNIRDFKNWYDAIDDAHKMKDWDVVLAGKKSDNAHQWNGVGKISRTRKISGMNTADSQNICIGALSDPSEWHADLKDWSDSRRLSDEEKMEIRKQYGKDMVPLIVIHCIDKDSQPTKKMSQVRQPLHAEADIIGISIHIPGQRLNKDYCVRVRINIDDNSY